MSATFSPGIQTVQTETEAMNAVERARLLAVSNRVEMARNATPMVRVRVIVGFTIHDDPHHQNPVVIEPGSELEIRQYDLERNYRGKVGRIMPDGSILVAS